MCEMRCLMHDWMPHILFGIGVPKNCHAVRYRLSVLESAVPMLCCGIIIAIVKYLISLPILVTIFALLIATD